MATLPQLLEEDVQNIHAALVQFLSESEATAALVTDKAGFLLVSAGATDKMEIISLASLAAGSFMATQEIARLINEPNFSTLYHQGSTRSLFVSNVDASTLLIVVFPAEGSVGLVKYFSNDALRKVAAQLAAAHGRNPEGGLDLSMLNLADPSPLFKKKSP